MKKDFGNSENSRFEMDLDSDSEIGVEEDSTNQIAIVQTARGEAVSALPARNESILGTFDMEVSYLPMDPNLLRALSLLRENYLDDASFSRETQFLTSISDFSERTRILALDGEILALTDIELFEWLVNAERQMYLGTDNHPVFEMPLEDTACSFTRLPNGQIAMTEASRDSINTARAKMRSVFGVDAIGSLNLAIETPTRSAIRYYLTAVPKGVSTASAGRDNDLTAFLLVGRSGFSYGLWSPSAGLFSEHAFLAPEGIDLKLRSRNEGARSGEDLESYVRHAMDQLALQLAPEKLEELGLSKYAEVVWATERDLNSEIGSIITSYSKKSGLDFSHIGVPIHEAVVGGLLFGSFTFGDETAVGAETLPQVNLARDLLVLADKEEVRRRKIGEIRLQKRRRQAVFTLLAAPVLVLAFLFGVIADHLTRQTYYAIREARADARTAELKPALERRKAYKANLKWYQEFITQVSRLRKHQPVGIGMLYQLNQSYPFEIDSSFYVEELKLEADAGIEITGLARNKDAVTSFLRSLEFAGGAESGSRLFSNLTYEVKEGVELPATPAGQTAADEKLTGSTLTGSGPPPGIIAWTIRGNYLPMMEFLPPDPKAEPPPNAAAAPAVPKGQPGAVPAAKP
ncbi:MAG: hypothetical protein OEM82_07725 [Acidobacteriota bacterium]|nr:hypothetical protein [Acidobacteriota bacterium]MDH3529491.1 hypothetical protein [Acidobacteriota bacterium]